MLTPLPSTLVPFLGPYLPRPKENSLFVTLTWAQSLDSRIAAQQGVQTKISHPETKTMTHYLRSRHDAILVGIGTVLADDPKLNCRFGDAQIRPVVVDPHARWNYQTSQLRQICAAGDGLAPYIIVGQDTRLAEDAVAALEAQGGAYVAVPLGPDRTANWVHIFKALHSRDIASVMVEGGAVVINDLLGSELVDSVVITIGPVFLGKQGVEVSPLAGQTLANVAWWRGTSDAVMAATPRP